MKFPGVFQFLRLVPVKDGFLKFPGSGFVIWGRVLPLLLTLLSARKKEEDERKKKEAMAALNSTNFKQTQSKSGGRAERERKKKALAARRKPINVDHLEKEKLVEKLSEMNDYLNQLFEER